MKRPTNHVKRRPSAPTSQRGHREKQQRGTGSNPSASSFLAAWRWRIAATAVAIVAILACKQLGWLPWPTSQENDTRLVGYEAFTHAVALEASGRIIESVPYYRRALETSPENSISMRRAYARILNNAALEVRDRGGVQIYGTRSSAARVQLAHESLRQLQIALAEAGDPQTRAMLLDDAGRTEEWWGLSWDALQDYTLASQLAPQSVEIRDHARRCAARLLAGATTAP